MVDVESLRIKPDFFLPNNVRVYHLTDYEPARQALQDINQAFLRSMDEERRKSQNAIQNIIRKYGRFTLD